MKLHWTPTRPVVPSPAASKPSYNPLQTRPVSQSAVRFGMSELEVEFFRSVIDGKTENLEDYIVNRGVNVNVKDDLGWTPLIWASYNSYDKKYEKVVEILIKHGADVNILPEHGYSALMYAAEYGNLNIARQLVEAGADVDAATPGGLTAKEHAVYCEHYHIWKYLTDLDTPSASPAVTPSPQPTRNADGTVTVSFQNAVGDMLAQLKEKMDALANTKN